MNTNSDRSEYRLNEELLVYVEACSSPTGDSTPPTLLISKTIDISANGIQISFDYPLIKNSILRLCIETPDEQSFILTGEVMWQRNASPLTLIGFRLLDSEHTDIGLWKQYISKKLLAQEE